MEHLNRHYNQLIVSLQFIILSYRSKREVLPEYYVDMIFEVISTYENSFLLSPQLIENNILSNEVIANMIRIYIFIPSAIYYENMTDEEFFNSTEWLKIEKIAKETLLLLKEPLATDLRGKV